MMPGGAYIASPSHDYVLPETPMENIITMYETVRDTAVLGEAMPPPAGPKLERSEQGTLDLVSGFESQPVHHLIPA